MASTIRQLGTEVLSMTVHKELNLASDHMRELGSASFLSKALR